MFYLSWKNEAKILKTWAKVFFGFIPHSELWASTEVSQVDKCVDMAKHHEACQVMSG